MVLAFAAVIYIHFADACVIILFCFYNDYCLYENISAPTNCPKHVYVCALFYYHPANVFTFFLISFHIYYPQQTQSIIKSFKVEEGIHRPEYKIIRVDAKFCSTYFLFVN